MWDPVSMIHQICVSRCVKRQETGISRRNLMDGMSLHRWSIIWQANVTKVSRSLVFDAARQSELIKHTARHVSKVCSRLLSLMQRNKLRWSTIWPANVTTVFSFLIFDACARNWDKDPHRVFWKAKRIKGNAFPLFHITTQNKSVVHQHWITCSPHCIWGAQYWTARHIRIENSFWSI